MPNVPGTNYAYSSDTNKNLNTHRASGMPEVGEKNGSMAVTSTNIEVWANNMKIGFVQTLTPSESRTIVKVQELGTEGVVQSVPSNTNGGQLSITRFAVYNGNLFNAMGATNTGKFTDKDSFAADPANTLNAQYNTYGNPFKTLKDQRVPLEIKVKTKMPSNQTTYYIETYVDCWLASYSKSIAATTITVTEQATIQYSDVFANYVTG